MNTNMGPIDRAVRVVLGLILIAFSIPIGVPATEWGWIGWIGIVPILTALVGFCPLYALLGISTSEQKRACEFRS
jgi:hypothetical protein